MQRNLDKSVFVHALRAATGFCHGCISIRPIDFHSSVIHITYRSAGRCYFASINGDR
jgi:hypothetical protein